MYGCGSISIFYNYYIIITGTVIVQVIIYTGSQNSHRNEEMTMYTESQNSHENGEMTMYTGTQNSYENGEMTMYTVGLAGFKSRSKVFLLA